MMQLAIIPPVFIYGLYFSEVFKSSIKRVFYIFYSIITLILLYILILQIF